MNELRLVALNGCLGYGFELESLQRGADAQPHMFGADAGSTDAGPYYLGSGSSMIRREQLKRDLSLALAQSRASRVPLVIGSAGIAGGEPNLQAAREVLIETAREQGLQFKLATIHAGIDPSAVLDALRSGGIEAMPGVPPLTEQDVRDSVRIVGQMGCEPFARALADGADVVLAGRACDTAIYAALPIARGFDPGLALHLAKIMECGAQCAVPQGTNDCLLGTLRSDHFEVRPLSHRRICTPESVAAHTLYEQGDPLMLHEPEGRVDLRAAVFEQVDAQTVRVSGSRFLPTPGLQIKLEGARSAGFRAFTLAGIRDAGIIAALDAIEATVRAAVRRNLPAEVPDADYCIDFKVYGRDAVLGPREPNRDRPGHEVGVLVEVVARTQALASHALSLARSSLLHCPFPGRKTTAGNLAFPFSPSDTAAGEVFEFSVYHLMRVADQSRLFPVDMERV
ncbi:acyclic terpene utilization AtuA family protein [Variovorax saccharolyticus]|uniref:acyclic terpene utilization AtuA family protein n=1 Tax=Variovorax saccharolyticus TaxID=3053516 RepID=UPI0025770349|nr:acyclic terpene utilization AtuA family protein [Variovorax sp. J31P216]MDM0026714.1 acyclic terpene utilization AtuA family protein [Variovorax sp. J31P216]